MEAVRWKNQGRRTASHALKEDGSTYCGSIIPDDDTVEYVDNHDCGRCDNRRVEKVKFKKQLFPPATPEDIREAMANFTLQDGQIDRQPETEVPPDLHIRCATGSQVQAGGWRDIIGEPRG